MINHFNFLACSLGQRELCVCDCIKNNWFDSVFIWFCRRFLFFKNEWTFSLFSHFCTSPDFVFIILFFISEKRNRFPQFFPPVFFFGLSVYELIYFRFFFSSVPTCKGFSISHTLYTDTRARARRQSCWSNKLSNWFELFDNFSWSKREETCFFRPVFTFRCKK